MLYVEANIMWYDTYFGIGQGKIKKKYVIVIFSEFILNYGTLKTYCDECC